MVAQPMSFLFPLQPRQPLSVFPLSLFLSPLLRYKVLCLITHPAAEIRKCPIITLTSLIGDSLMALMEGVSLYC